MQGLRARNVVSCMRARPLLESTRGALVAARHGGNLARALTGASYSTRPFSRTNKCRTH